jgi:hypothetical protein
VFDLGCKFSPSPWGVDVSPVEPFPFRFGVDAEPFESVDDAVRVGFFEVDVDDVATPLENRFDLP